ncbi:hypothetical protein [Deinococcus marmoris]|uniref:Uncharacterized protein n=1 Tax=Deinococcus marmoris TaxID=249408 RepID=A0A1U7P3H3_9DEIO|nr:hypothetical protein [Deinococcus marmoris]OLV19727.1 hypothetical protein BOO71_0001906 [Deinococcus marmoris]
MRTLGRLLGFPGVFNTFQSESVSPHIHMYAGVPLTTPTGHRIGTLGVTDDQPHPPSADDL